MNFVRWRVEGAGVVLLASVVPTYVPYKPTLRVTFVRALVDAFEESSVSFLNFFHVIP
jgi:hypothetical protein